MAHQLRLLGSFIKVHWSIHTQYRFGALIWLVNGLILPLIIMGIWLVIGRDQNLALDQTTIITYYLLTIIVFRLTQSWAAEDLAFGIKDGIFSNFLIKPFYYQLIFIGKDLALKTLRLIMLIPVIALLTVILHQYIAVPLDPFRWFLFILAVLGGYLIELILSLTIGLTAFWVVQAYGGFVLYYLVKQLLSGALLPLVLMPDWLSQIAYFLPFQYIVYFPVQILLTPALTQREFVSFICLPLWLIILVILNCLVYRQGIKEYTAIGI